MHMCKRACICMCVHACVSMHAHVYVYCAYVYMCVYVRVCVHVCAWAPPAPLRCSTSGPFLSLSSASLVGPWQGTCELAGALTEKSHDQPRGQQRRAEPSWQPTTVRVCFQGGELSPQPWCVRGYKSRGN